MNMTYSNKSLVDFMTKELGQGGKPATMSINEARALLGLSPITKDLEVKLKELKK